MKSVGNFIWFIFFFGWAVGLLWVLSGIIMYISIIGIPWGKSCFTIAEMSFFPFGKVAINRKELTQKDDVGTGIWGLIGNIVWFLLGGILLALTHIVAGISLCLTIIGIPFGIQHFKLAGLSFFPIGKKIVNKEIADAARKSNAQDELDKFRGVDSKSTDQSQTTITEKNTELQIQETITVDNAAANDELPALEKSNGNTNAHSSDQSDNQIIINESTIDKYINELPETYKSLDKISSSIKNLQETKDSLSDDTYNRYMNENIHKRGLILKQIDNVEKQALETIVKLKAEYNELLSKKESLEKHKSELNTLLKNSVIDETEHENQLNKLNEDINTANNDIETTENKKTNYESIMNLVNSEEYLAIKRYKPMYLDRNKNIIMKKVESILPKKDEDNEKAKQIKKYMLIFVPVIIVILIFVWQKDSIFAIFEGKETLTKVNARGGLMIRDIPSLNGKKIAIIPNGSLVKITEEDNKEMVLFKRKGKWVRVKWNNFSGWSFSGFLVDPSNNIAVSPSTQKNITQKKPTSTEKYSGIFTGWSGSNNKIRYSFNAGSSGTVKAHLRFNQGNNAYLAGADSNLQNKTEQKNRSGYHKIQFKTDGGQFGITIGLDQSSGSSNYQLTVEHP